MVDPSMDVSSFIRDDPPWPTNMNMRGPEAAHPLSAMRQCPTPRPCPGRSPATSHNGAKHRNHGEEVGKSFHKNGVLAKLLVKGVRKVVRWVRRDNQDAFSDERELSRDGAARPLAFTDNAHRIPASCLPNTTLSANENPFQCLLV